LPGHEASERRPCGGAAREAGRLSSLPRPLAAFFERFGFSVDAWNALRDALLEHTVVDTGTSGFGIRFTVEASLRSLDGRNPQVRSVWFIDAGADTPRLVTAYPQRKETP
jgi:hypothetical protein